MDSSSDAFPGSQSTVDVVVNDEGGPRLPELITNWGLYSPVTPRSADPENAIKLWRDKWAAADYRFDAYCVGCQRVSIFSGAGDAEAKKVVAYVPPPMSLSARGSNYSRPELPFGARSRNFFCLRNSAHRMTVHLQIDANAIEKVGQYPSIADMAWPELSRFRKLLGVERLAELKKAYGLFSHGVGAGSLIYLRRVLELVVELARSEMLAVEGMLPKGFDGERFEEKVKLLKRFVPEAFYENRKLYGLISAGLHSLTEKECLAIFPVAWLGIDSALSAVQARRDEAEKTAAVSHAVAAKASEIERLISGLKDQPSSR